jgi:hypothetical protein
MLFMPAQFVRFYGKHGYESTNMLIAHHDGLLEMAPTHSIAWQIALTIPSH